MAARLTPLGPILDPPVRPRSGDSLQKGPGRSSSSVARTSSNVIRGVPTGGEQSDVPGDSRLSGPRPPPLPPNGTADRLNRLEPPIGRKRPASGSALLTGRRPWKATPEIGSERSTVGILPPSNLADRSMAVQGRSAGTRPPSRPGEPRTDTGKLGPPCPYRSVSSSAVTAGTS